MTHQSPAVPPGSGFQFMGSDPINSCLDSVYKNLMGVRPHYEILKIISR